MTIENGNTIPRKREKDVPEGRMCLRQSVDGVRAIFEGLETGRSA